MLVGRSRKCDLRLPHPSVSGEHALIWWAGDGWSIRDLSSRNGTLVNGAPLSASHVHTLAQGDALGFGHYPISWIVESTAAPMPRAVRMDGKGEARTRDSMLAVPSPEAPLALVYVDPLQGWVLESADAMRAVEDLETVSLGDGVWRLHLPSVLSSTISSSPEALLLGQVALTFRVSADEEHVQLQATVKGRAVDLGSRAHNYALLTLARRRLQEAAAGSVGEAEQGWMYQEELMEMLQLSRTQLNLLVFRVRKQFAALDVANARDIVERRPDSRQLRIGTGLLSVETA